MKKIHVLLILLACGLIVPGFSSCTKENMDECPVQLTVIAKPEILETYPQRYVIDSIVVYVFDAEDRFVTSKQGGAYTPGGEYVFDIDLDPGSYTFLAWTNAGDYYKSTHSLEQCYAEKPSLSEMKTYLQYPQDGRILEDIPELHYGQLSNAVVLGGGSQDFVMELIPDTYRVNFTVLDLPVTDDTFNFTVTDDNSHYTYENSIVPDMGDFKHIRNSGFVDGELYASILSLKLDLDRTPRFVFSGHVSTIGEDVLYDHGLVAMIKRAYVLNGQELDFSKIFEFDIIISFNATLDECEIIINGWELIDQPVILD